MVSWIDRDLKHCSHDARGDPKSGLMSAISEAHISATATRAITPQHKDHARRLPYVTALNSGLFKREAGRSARTIHHSSCGFGAIVELVELAIVVEHDDSRAPFSEVSSCHGQSAVYCALTGDVWPVLSGGAENAPPSSFLRHKILYRRHVCLFGSLRQ